MRRWIGTSAAVIVIPLLAGCAGAGARTSAEADAENPMVLRLAHNLSDTHVTSAALVDFAAQVEEDSGGRITVDIFPNGQLGSETEVMEQLMAGVVDMTRVSSPGLATYNEGYHTFGLPYLFDDTEQYYRVMDSDGMRAFFDSTAEDGFVGLTYYTSGSRSFYTVNDPIRTPDDLQGMKIRVQDMRSQTDMINALGGTPVVMAFGDTYTALQTSIIDGAESNETVLTLSKHGEVAKVFSQDQHTMIPDMLVMGTSTWERLSPEDQELLVGAAVASTQEHKEAWAEETDAAVAEATEEMDVEFVTDVDIEAFQEATAPTVERYAEEFPGVADLLSTIEAEQ